MVIMLILFLAMMIVIIAVCFFSNLKQLLLLPLITPEQFLSSMPHFSFSLFSQKIIFTQPSSTIFVYGLGLLMIIIGLYFYVTRKNQKTRELWGIGLVLWGIGAILAGTSYQAFGYELKCKAQEYCLFTDNFELAYMLVTAYSINFLVAATGYASLGPVGRKRLILFALIDSIVYSGYMFIGAIIPIKFLISYEGFMAFIGFNFILMFILNSRHYVKFKDPLNRNFIMIWIGFLVVNVGYFAYLFGGFGTALYQNFGLWFTENDVLHVLLILWGVIIFLSLKSNMKDITQ